MFNVFLNLILSTIFFVFAQRENNYNVLVCANLHFLHPKKLLVRQVFLVQFSVVDWVNEDDVFSVNKIFLLLQRKLQHQHLWLGNLRGILCLLAHNNLLFFFLL